MANAKTRKVRVKVPMKEMFNADVEWVSLVSSPANRIPFRVTKAEMEEIEQIQKQGRPVNRSGVTTARRAISGGRVNTTTPWTFTAADGNRLLGPNGDNWRRFGSVHLGRNPDATENTKDAWRYPVAKLVGGRIIVFRSGVRAARTRSAQQGDTEVSNAARGLLDEMNRREQRSETGDIRVNLIKLAEMFGGSKQNPPEDRVALAAVVIRESDADLLGPVLEQQGYVIDDVYKVEGDDTLVLKQFDFDESDITAFKVNEDIGVLVTGVSKQFSPFLDSASFSETMAAQGFLPSLMIASESMQDAVRSVLRSSDSSADASKKVSSVLKEFNTFVTALVSNLPEVSFKMEELADIAIVRDNVEKEEAEETQKAKAKAQVTGPGTPAGTCPEGQVWRDGMCVNMTEKEKAAAKAKASKSEEETEEKVETKAEGETEEAKKEDTTSEETVEKEETVEDETQEEAAKAEDEDPYDYDDPDYQRAVKEADALKKAGVKMEGVLGTNILHPVPPLKKKASEEEKQEQEATQASEGDQESATKAEQPSDDGASEKILRAIGGLTDEIREVRKEQKALGQRVNAVETQTKKHTRKLDGTVLSGGDFRDESLATLERNRATKDDDDPWKGTALDRIFG